MNTGRTNTKEYNYATDKQKIWVFTPNDGFKLKYPPTNQSSNINKDELNKVDNLKC